MCYKTFRLNIGSRESGLPVALQVQDTQSTTLSALIDSINLSADAVAGWPWPPGERRTREKRTQGGATPTPCVPISHPHSPYSIHKKVIKNKKGGLYV
jgi:hypothetical protein